MAAGREMAENNRDTRRVFAACINEDGETIWRATLDAQENEQCSVTGAMQLEDGRIQLMLNRSREVNHEFEYDLYELATLSADGELLDRRRLHESVRDAGRLCARRLGQGRAENADGFL